jgi:hypothetical protein
MHAVYIRGMEKLDREDDAFEELFMEAIRTQSEIVLPLIEKSLRHLRVPQEPDGSMSYSHVEGYERYHDQCLDGETTDGKLPAPEVCFEVFTGYNSSGLHNSPDPSYPRPCAGDDSSNERQRTF